MGEVRLRYQELAEVTRDVVYFFYLQAAYDHVEEDIEYALLKLPYWKYLDLAGASIEGEARLLLERGCLLIVVAMALAEAGNICLALNESLAECLRACRQARFSNETTERLRVLAVGALEVADTDQATRDWERVRAMSEEADWTHERIVRDYFRNEGRLTP